VWGSLSPGEGRHLIGWRLSFEIDIPALSPQWVLSARFGMTSLLWSKAVFGQTQKQKRPGLIGLCRSLLTFDIQSIKPPRVNGETKLKFISISPVID
jgi:hypothetical protein